MLCGKLVCTWPHKALVRRRNLSVIYTHVRDDLCTSTFLTTERTPRNTLSTIENPEDRDQTFVEDGTVCGPEMVIITKYFKCFKNYFLCLYSFCQYTNQCILKQPY